MHIKEESDRGYHSIHIHGRLRNTGGVGHLNFNIMSGILNLRIKIQEETFSFNLIWQSSNEVDSRQMRLPHLQPSTEDLTKTQSEPKPLTIHFGVIRQF